MGNGLGVGDGSGVSVGGTGVAVGSIGVAVCDGSGRWVGGASVAVGVTGVGDDEAGVTVGDEVMVQANKRTVAAIKNLRIRFIVTPIFPIHARCCRVEFFNAISFNLPLSGRAKYTRGGR